MPEALPWQGGCSNFVFVCDLLFSQPRLGTAAAAAAAVLQELIMMLMVLSTVLREGDPMIGSPSHLEDNRSQRGML